MTMSNRAKRKQAERKQARATDPNRLATIGEVARGFARLHEDTANLAGANTKAFAAIEERFAALEARMDHLEKLCLSRS